MSPYLMSPIDEVYTDILIRSSITLLLLRLLDNFKYSEVDYFRET